MDLTSLERSSRVCQQAGGCFSLPKKIQLGRDPTRKKYHRDDPTPAAGLPPRSLIMSTDDRQAFLDEAAQNRGYTLEMHRIMATHDLEWARKYNHLLKQPTPVNGFWTARLRSCSR